MSRILFKSFIAITAIFFAAVPGWAHGGSSNAGPHLPPGVEKQDPEAALKTDVQLVATANDASYEAVAEAVAFQDAFVAYAQDLSERYPNGISRIWLESAPAIQGYVQFTGAVPNEDAPDGVKLLGGGGIVVDHHLRRAELAADALEKQEYKNFMTFFDAASGKLRLEIVVDPKAPQPDPQEVFEGVAETVWNDKELYGDALIVKPSDLDLRITRREGAIFDFDHGRGGNELRDDGNFECTSGWSVNGPNGGGIITAAHCSGLNQFVEPGVATFGMTWRRQEFDRGDVEYHTTTHIEVPEFFASSVQVRDVLSTRSTFWMLPGQPVCVYGRASNVRNCNHVMIASRVSLRIEGTRLRRMAVVTGDSSIGGDSGGGWSWNNQAWGVHSASNGLTSIFTPVRRAETELNVDVLLAP